MDKYVTVDSLDDQAFEKLCKCIKENKNLDLILEYEQITKEETDVFCHPVITHRNVCMYFTQKNFC